LEAAERQKPGQVHIIEEDFLPPQPSDGADLLTQQAAADPMMAKRLATKPQRDMILAVASKHKNMTPEALDQLLADKFTFTLATLPMHFVNDALQLISAK